MVQCGDKVFIGGFFEILGDKPFAGNQLVDADAEFPGEQRQHLHIRQVAAGLPTEMVLLVTPRRSPSAC